VGTGFQLLEDGTGYGATFYFNNDEGDPIEMRGGQAFTTFTYATRLDGAITLNFDQGYQPDVDYFKGMTLRYQDGHISVASPHFTTQLELASEQVAALIEQWDQTMNGGASADNYNINDEDFTPTTWRGLHAGEHALVRWRRAVQPAQRILRRHHPRQRMGVGAQPLRLAQRRELQLLRCL